MCLPFFCLAFNYTIKKQIGKEPIFVCDFCFLFNYKINKIYVMRYFSLALDYIPDRIYVKKLFN